MLSFAAIASLLLLAPAPSVAPTVNPELAAISREMRAIFTLSAHMHQTKTLSVLDEVVESDGTLVFARPRRLAMDLAGEGGNTLIIDGDTMTMVYKALSNTERTLLSRDPRARAVAEHLFLLLEANPEALAPLYSLDVQHKAPLKIRLTPKAEALARILSFVDATFDKRGFVTELLLEETNGDTTRWTFDNPKINQPVSDNAFRVAP